MADDVAPITLFHLVNNWAGRAGLVDAPRAVGRLIPSSGSGSGPTNQTASWWRLTENGRVSDACRFGWVEVFPLPKPTTKDTHWKVECCRTGVGGRDKPGRSGFQANSSCRKADLSCRKPGSSCRTRCVNQGGWVGRNRITQPAHRTEHVLSPQFISGSGRQP